MCLLSSELLILLSRGVFSRVQLKYLTDYKFDEIIRERVGNSK